MNSERTNFALKECINFIESHKSNYQDDDSPLVIDEDEKSFEITDERIFQIPECDDYRNLGFVDGGNEPIIKSSDFNISLCRVAGILYDAKSFVQLQKMPSIIEFYSATIIETFENDNLYFITRLFPREERYKKYLPKKDIKISFKDPSIRIGGKFLFEFERFGGIAMRFAEWTYANHFIESELNNGDIFIRDGSLQTGYMGEIEYANELFTTGLKKNVIITGLSKSCRLITKNGNSLIALIDYHAKKKFPKESWYYHPILKITKADNQADIYFVKFNKLSTRPFRFDIYLKQAKTLDQKKTEIILSNLVNNSNDLSFIGYPYGLIKVDQMARISKRELESEKIQLLVEFDKEIYEQFILPRLQSVDAHDILNKIRK
jgi:hypothetical protein